MVGWLVGGGVVVVLLVCVGKSLATSVQLLKSNQAPPMAIHTIHQNTPNQLVDIMAIHRISCLLLLSPLVIAWCFCHVRTVRGMYASSAWGLVNVSASAGDQWTNVLFSSDNGAAIAAAAANGSPTLYPWTGWAVPRPGHEHTPCISPIKRYY